MKSSKIGGFLVIVGAQLVFSLIAITIFQRTFHDSVRIIWYHLAIMLLLDGAATLFGTCLFSIGRLRSRAFARCLVS